jgi:hypothetical protein
MHINYSLLLFVIAFILTVISINLNIYLLVFKKEELSVLNMIIFKFTIFNMYHNVINILIIITPNINIPTIQFNCNKIYNTLI